MRYFKGVKFQFVRLAALFSFFGMASLASMQTYSAGPLPIGPTVDYDGTFIVKAKRDHSFYELDKLMGQNAYWFSRSFSGGYYHYTISNLGSGSYQYYSKYCSDGGTGVSCSEDSFNTSPITVVVVIKPGVPGSISVLPATSTNGTFPISWPAPSGQANSYTLQQQINGGGWTTVYSGGSRSRTITGLNDGSYRYRIRACMSVSGYTQCSNYRTSGTVNVVKVPGTPGGISTPATDADGAFSLSWGASTGNVDSYRLEQRVNSGAWSQIQSSTSRTAAISGATSGTYSYRVRACNTSGCSGYSATASTNVSIPLAPPTAPAWNGSSATDSDFGDYDLMWDTAAGVISYYQLQERIDGGSWGDVTLVNTLSYDARGKIAGDYDYRVRACNADGCSGWNSHSVEVHNLQGVAPAVSIAAANVPGTMPYYTFVSPQGSSQIVIPLQMVPGVNNAQPNLSISYTSGRSRQRQEESLPEDILGYGWQLGGGSEIRRCVKGRSDVTEVQLGITDTLCINGEPLRLVSGVNFQPNAEYRPLRDDFIKVVIHGTAAEPWFKAYHPNGTVLEFGNSTHSRVRVKDANVTTPYYIWSLNKSTDAFGNSVTYQYHKDEVSGINYPLSIQYGDNNDVNVSFLYARRDDAVPIVMANIQPEQLVLLHTISIKLNGAMVREYRLASEVATEGWRRLDQVQECGFDKTGNNAQCFNPLNFRWFSDTNSDYKTAIDQFTDGLGAVTEFDYELMTPAHPYGRFFEQPFGNGVLPADTELLLEDENYFFKSVVTEYRKSNGLGGFHQMAYRYQGEGVVSSKNWGFLGFFAQRITDMQSGVVTYRQFRMDEPHFIQIAAEHQYDNTFGNHTETYSKIEHQYSTETFTHSNNATTQHPYRSSTIEHQYENNVVLGYVKTEVSNQYSGNLLSQSITTRSHAHSATSTGGGGYWGDTPSYGLSGVQRTTLQEQNFQNRVGSQWLVGFISELEEFFYRGTAISTNLDRSTRFTFTPHASSNEPVTIVQYPGDTDLELTETRSYNSDGLLTTLSRVGQSVAARTVVSNSSFTAGRYPTVQVNAEGHTYNQSYDARFGVADQISDPNNRVTNIDYDGFGRQISLTSPDGVTHTTQYESCDLIFCPTVGSISPVYSITTQSSTSPDQIQYFDQLGRVIRSAIQSFDGVTYVYRDVHYDSQGRIDRFSQPYFAGDTAYFTQNGYDVRDRLEAQIRPNNGSVTVDFVPNAATSQVEVTMVEDVFGETGTLKEQQTTVSHYNIMGEMVSIVDASGTVDSHGTTYGYYADGLLRENIAGGNTTTLQYDSAGNRIGLIDPSFGTVTYQYTALNELLHSVDNKGQITSYSYDLLSRRTQEQNPDGIANWTYDPANAVGALASRRYGTGHVETYTYNSDARLIDVQTDISVPGFSRTYHHGMSYDSFGRLQTTTPPTGLTTEHTYNSHGYVSAIENATTGDALIFYQATDAFGNTTSQTFGNGIVQTRTYDQKVGTAKSIHSVLGATTLQDSAYGWQTNGMLEHRSDDSGATAKQELLVYDSLNRLTTSTSSIDNVIERVLTTSYTPNGNITSKISDIGTDPSATNYIYGSTTNASDYAVSSVNRSGVQNTLHYDANGSITQYDASSGDDRFISWSARNLPTKITLGASENDVLPTARDEISYDADGNRYYKKSSWEDDLGALQVEHTFYVGEFEEIVSSNDSSYQGVRKSLIADDVLHVVATLDNLTVVNDFEYLLRDHLGSVEKVTDGSGAVLLVQAFDPFGERRSESWLTGIADLELDALLDATEVATSRGYTGHEHLSRTGIIHMNGRIYDPQIARFLSPDPIVQSDSSQNWNRYSYVLNSPVSLSDPTGYCFEASGYATCNDNTGGFGTLAPFVPRTHYLLSSIGTFNFNFSFNGSGSGSNPSSATQAERVDTGSYAASYSAELQFEVDPIGNDNLSNQIDRLIRSIRPIKYGAKSLFSAIGAAIGHAGAYYYSGACATITGASSCEAVFSLVSNDAGRIGRAYYDFRHAPLIRARVLDALYKSHDITSRSDFAQGFFVGRIGAQVGLSQVPTIGGAAILAIPGGALQASQIYGDAVTLDQIITMATLGY